MESIYSSPNYMKATSSSDAKKEDSRGRNESDDMVSINSSTCGSSVNGPSKLNNDNNGVKYRTNNNRRKFALKNNFGIAKSFRRRAKSRIAQPSVVMSDDECLIDSPNASPCYSKGTSSSEGKKKYHVVMTSPQHSCESSSFDLQSVARTSNVRNVRILLKRTSFKPKRVLGNYSRAYGDVSVNRATYSSALRGSKFPDMAEEDYSAEKETEKKKICRYHHCSLHGHCRGDHDPSQPLKRVLNKKRSSLKKQQSVMLKTESKTKCSGEKKRVNVKENQMSARDMDHSNREWMNVSDDDGVDSYAESYNEHENVEDRYGSVQDSDFLEVAFGEMSFPEISYRENLNIQRKYSFWLTGHCLGCSCNEREKTTPLKRQDNAKFSINESFSPEITVKSNVISQKIINSSSSVSDIQDSGGDDTENGEFSNECDATDDAKAAQVKNLELNSAPAIGGNLQFSKPRHISMWHLIHQHMSANLSSESENKELEVENVQDQTHCSDSESLNNNDSEEVGDIEVRKLFAIKLVREAIEKILLPEVQDQTSDDQSVNEISSQPYLDKENQNENGEDGGFITNLKDGTSINDASASETVVTERKIASNKPLKKAPKHWSNLKKWVLLQRFIKALEKVKKFNPRNPNHLPVINPDLEKEQVSLRHQASDERKRSEEWMLDYALRRAVNQLAPTQKKKVALLVKAFETVVPPHEDTAQSQFKITRLLRSDLDNDESQESGFKLETVKGIGNMNFHDPNVKSHDVNEETVSDVNPNSNLGVVKLEAVGTDKNDDESTLQHPERDAIFNSSVEADGKDDEQPKMEMEGKNNHISMWHILCQHVVSGIADKMGSQLLDGSDDEESLGKEPSALKSGDSCDKVSNCRTEEHVVSSVFTKSYALRIVKEAIEEILVHDDSSDMQSISSDLTSSEQVISSELKDNRSRNEEGTISEPELVKPKNWIKLKKLILLKRSIKALEKARKLKPQVNVISDAEQEKTNLRQHTKDERAKAEQWMLDYAVRNIVSKLTPSRKQRVSMLVEAFEAVVPIPDL